MLKSASEVLATLIIVGTLLGLTIFLYYTTLQTLNTSTIISEYGYAKTILINIAEALPSIISGGEYSASIPGRMVSVGWRGPIKFNITLDSTVISNETYVVYVAANYPIQIHRTVDYGVCDGKFSVDMLSLIPCVTTFYDNGWTYTVLDTSRLYLRVYSIEIPSRQERRATIIVVRIDKPVFTSTTPRRISLVFGGVESYVYFNITQVYFNGRPLLDSKVNQVSIVIYTLRFVAM